MKNYRPVSNLLLLSKILEKVVLMQLTNHLTSNHLTHKFQSAYRAGHSTEKREKKNSPPYCHWHSHSFWCQPSFFLTLLNLSPAFYTIDHSILLTCLEQHFDVSGLALSWFKSYMSNRFQFVSASGINSKLSKLDYGVSQGSVLSPVLFVLTHNLFHRFYSTTPVRTNSFVDDTQPRKSCSPEHYDDTRNALQTRISGIKAWMTENKLQLNADKTETMLFNFSKLKHPPAPLSICQATVSLSDPVRNLGFYLDKDLTMKEHTKFMCKTAFLETRRISTIRHYFTFDATKTLVVSLVLLRIDYCNSLLTGLPQSSVGKLQRAQNCAARLVVRAPPHVHVTPVLRRLHWLPVRARISYKIVCLCFNAITSSTPAYLSDLLHLYSPSRSLRSSADTRLLKIPLYKCKTKGHRAFSCFGPCVWNSLPLHIKNATFIDT